MITAAELSELYYKTYPDYLHDRLMEQTAEVETRLEAELKAAFPDQFLNFYIDLTHDNWLLWWDREGERFVQKLKQLGYNVRASRDRYEGEEKITINITWE